MLVGDFGLDESLADEFVYHSWYSLRNVETSPLVWEIGSSSFCLLANDTQTDLIW